MSFFEKLAEVGELAHKLSDAIEELVGTEPETEEEPQVLLTRSKRNRRSESNVGLTLTARDGAPAVPESWVVRPDLAGRFPGRQKLYDTLAHAVGKTRAQFWAWLKEHDPKYHAKNMKTISRTLTRLVSLGRVVVGPGGKLRAGK